MPFAERILTRALDGIVSGNFWLGLGLSSPEDEESAATYRRQAVSFGGEGTERSNPERVQFQRYEASGSGVVNYWVIWDSPRDGNIVASGRIINAHRPLLGESPEFDAGSIRLGLRGEV